MTPVCRRATANVTHGNSTLTEGLDEAFATLGTAEGDKDDADLDGLYKIIRGLADSCGDDREQFVSQLHLS